MENRWTKVRNGYVWQYSESMGEREKGKVKRRNMRKQITWIFMKWLT